MSANNAAIDFKDLDNKVIDAKQKIIDINDILRDIDTQISLISHKKSLRNEHPYYIDKIISDAKIYSNKTKNTIKEALNAAHYDMGDIDTKLQEMITKPIIELKDKCKKVFEEEISLNDFERALQDTKGKISRAGNWFLNEIDSLPAVKDKKIKNKAERNALFGRLSTALGPARSGGRRKRTHRARSHHKRTHRRRTHNKRK